LNRISTVFFKKQAQETDLDYFPNCIEKPAM
jgi:hypothetical protein